MELVFRRIADRPTAHPVVDRQHRGKTAILQNHGIFLDDLRRRGRDMRDGSPCNGASRPLGSRRTGASGKAKTVDFADDRVARDAAQDAGDLACRKPFGPERLQLLNPLVRPAHNAPPGLNPQNIVPGERSNTSYEAYLP